MKDACRRSGKRRHTVGTEVSGQGVVISKHNDGWQERKPKGSGGQNEKNDPIAEIIKDDHLKLMGSLTAAVRKFKKQGGLGKIEVEDSFPDEVLEAARACVDMMMLDNMTPGQILCAIKLLEKE
ncbi:MAG: hypothetical protein ACUVQM_02765 [Candidatus Hadarchaeaceae archaeon]